jgi:VanZ family protein
MRLARKDVRMGIRIGAPLVTLALTIYWITIFTGTHLPNHLVSAVTLWDKLVHATAFAGLSFLIACAWRPKVATTSQRMLVGLLAGATYAVIDEWTQRFVPGRSSDLLDLVADSVGIAIGLSSFAAFRILRSAIRRRRSALASRG